MDRAIYQKPVSRVNPKISIEETCIEILSSFNRGGIEKHERRFFKEEKQHKMNEIKIDTKTSNQEALKHIINFKCKAFLDQNTLKTSNQFYFQKQV